MRIVSILLCLGFLLGWLLINPNSPPVIDQDLNHDPLGAPGNADTNNERLDAGHSPLSRTVAKPQSEEPDAQLWNKFKTDLAELYKSEDGRAFRYDQQNRKVDELLSKRQPIPVDGLDSSLERAGTLVPLRSLDAFQSVGLTEMEFLRNRILSQSGMLKRWPREALLGENISAEGKGHDTSSLQAKIRSSPLSYPPEVIFAAFSKTKQWPSSNKDFISALANSRDLGLLKAAATWMEYSALSDTALWMATFPEYQEYSINSKNLKALPALQISFDAYLEAEQEYLYMILGDMGNYGYF